MSRFPQFMYETHVIETSISSQEYMKIHEEEVEKYTKDGWKMLSTITGYSCDQPMRRTELERYTPLPKRGLRTQVQPIDDACIEVKITEEECSVLKNILERIK